VSISIRTNINSVSTARQLGYSQEKVDLSMQRLSTGLRVNKAADDAAGLAISEKLKSQINGLNQASRNAKDAISLVQTAEGALGEIGNMLQRIRTLALQSVNDVNSISERTSMQKEVAQLQTEMTRLALASEFNGKKLLDGSFQSQRFQVGANSGQEIAVSISGVDASKLGVNRVATVGGTASTASISAVSAGADVTATVAANRLTAQTLTITGPATGGTPSTVALTAGMTAKEVADAVNSVNGETGVLARARTAVKLQNLTVTGGAAANVSFTLGGDINGGGLGSSTVVGALITDPTDLSKLAEAINEKSSVTGITATVGDSKAELVLSADDGRDIVMQDLTINGVAPTATDNLTVQGLTAAPSGSPDFGVGLQPAGAAVVMNAAGSDSVRVGGFVRFDAAGGVNMQTTDATGSLLATQSENSTLIAVNTVSLTSADGASGAIDVLDNAIQQVNDLRASLGAIQNRLQSTVANLESSSENLTVSNSRIRDADVAMESAELARSQVLMQAGISVLSQANQQPQMALKLLGG
jgi:flagellin